VHNSGEWYAARADLHAAMDGTAFDLASLFDWSERDEASGEGDAPYPPNYPKQPGEPPRVQPSRMNKANWTDDGKPVEPPASEQG
jgi:hypothetical protein